MSLIGEKLGQAVRFYWMIKKIIPYTFQCGSVTGIR